MIKAFKRISREIPLTFKMVFLTFMVGILVWSVIDRFMSNAVKTMFEKHLTETLEQQSQEDRLRFDRYMQAYHQVVSLIISQKKFMDYAEEKQWHNDDVITVKHIMKYPDWFLTPAAMRTLAIPGYAVLLDDGGNAREVYQRHGPSIPDVLLSPTELLLQKSRGQTHVTTLDKIPYLLTSMSVMNSRGVTITLLLASPIDDKLLTFAQGDFPKRLVGMVSDNNKIVLTSNNSELLPAGTMLSSIEDRYVVTSRSLTDYGGSETPLKFTSFISKENMEDMSSVFVIKNRKYSAISALLFIMSFTIIMLYITKRISRLTRRVEEFSHKALGSTANDMGHGDKLGILEDRFQLLTEEITASHEIIRMETEEAAIRKAESEQKDILFELLRSVMDALGIGILIRQDNGLLAANSTMEYFQTICTGPYVFEIQDNVDEERTVSDTDNNRHVFHLTSLTVRSDEKVILVRDITERKKLEDQLRHAQKMESIGQLAGGIAHDFNNFLTAIMGYGNILSLKLKNDDPLKDHVKQILLSSKKAAALTRSLLAFSRKQIMNPQPVDLNELVKSSEKLLSRLISEDIKLVTLLSDNGIIIKADSGQIEQVLLNLATNARDAMPDGGSLTIETGLVQLDKDFIRSHSDGAPGMYALLSIIDSGTGFNEKIKEKIFEPFFTTKEVGRGTGLGLSMVYGIVKQHGGFINVYSEPGEGSVFRIYLPAAEALIEEELSENLVPVKGGSETILVAEDDNDVARLIQNVLEDAGYMVIVTDNGDAAVHVFMENKDNVHLLLLDVIMPGKNGKDVLQEIMMTNPAVKALFLSGYTAELMHKKGILEEGVHFLSKPVSPNDLLRKVREVLDR